MPWDNTTIHAGVTASLTGVRRGYGSRDRIGKVILGKSITFRLRARFGKNMVGGTSAASCRFILFRWNEDEEPQPDDILLDPSRVESPYQTNSAGKCTVLYDRLFPLNTLQATQDISGHYAAAETTLSGTVRTPWRCIYDDTNDQQDVGDIRALIVCSENNFAAFWFGSQFFFTDV